MREAAKAIGCSKDTLYIYIKSKKIYKEKYKIKSYFP
jgi:hypothetical protein